MVYAINGRLKDSSNNPFGGILIKAYDTDPFYDDLPSSATTGIDGQFEIRLDTADYDPLGVEEEPEVYLMIIDSEKKFVSIINHFGACIQNSRVHR